MQTGIFKARMLIRLFLFFAILHLALNAQTKTVHLQAVDSKIEWALGSTLHTVHGSFKLKSGSIQFDPASGVATGEIVVDAKSGESGNLPRDSRMHKVVLESEKYPEIRFRPDRIEGSVKAE